MYMYIYKFYNLTTSDFLAYISSSLCSSEVKGIFLPWFGKDFVFSNIKITTSQQKNNFILKTRKWAMFCQNIYTGTFLNSSWKNRKLFAVLWLSRHVCRETCQETGNSHFLNIVISSTLLVRGRIFLLSFKVFCLCDLPCSPLFSWMRQKAQKNLILNLHYIFSNID